MIVEFLEFSSWSFGITVLVGLFIAALYASGNELEHGTGVHLFGQ
jgi:hypothetical protein